MLKTINALIYKNCGCLAQGEKRKPLFSNNFFNERKFEISSFPQKAHKNSKEFGSKKMNK